MEKSQNYKEATNMDHVANADVKEDQPDMEMTSDYSYFEQLQQQPMTKEDMAKFSFLVAFPTFFFIVAVVLMHIYND